MTVADASQNRILYREEVTYALAPTGEYTEVRLVSENLGENPEVVQSDEVVSDRMPPDNIRVGLGAGGDLNVEFHAKTFDDWLEAVLMSAAWTTKVSFAIACAQANAGGESTLTRAAGSFVTDGYTADSWIRISGATPAENNTYLKIKTVSPLVLTCDRGPLLTTQASESITIEQLSQAQNGTTLRTFALEREYQNLTAEFALLLGHAFQGFTIRTRGKDKVTASFTTIGKDETTKATTASSSIAAAGTEKVYSVTSDVVMFQVTGDATQKLTNFSIALANGLYAQDEEAGTLGPIGIGLGTVELTGSWEFYYKSGTIFTTAKSFTDADFALALEDAAANGYVFEVLRANYENPRRATPGKDQAVKGSFDWRSARGGAELLMLKICRTT